LILYAATPRHAYDARLLPLRFRGCAPPFCYFAVIDAALHAAAAD